MPTAERCGSSAVRTPSTRRSRMYDRPSRAASGEGEMPTCPRGHASNAADYCDVCGRAMTAGTPAATAPAAAAPAPPDPVGSCPECGTARTGRFCELDGYDFMTAGL